MFSEIILLLIGDVDLFLEWFVVSLLLGLIDVDKMDYLYCDSIYLGVLYGWNFDWSCLIVSFCVNEVGDGLVINVKGKMVVELMVFV